MQGKFITFEGGEGCGKSTQVEYLKTYLQRNRYEYVHCVEPGTTQTGQAIRSLLLHGEDLDPVTETLLFETARASVTSEIIRPTLDQGRIVISDRYFDSTTVYQGIVSGVSLDFITILNRFATGGLSPDLTFLLDPAQEQEDFLLESIFNQHPDRMESKGKAFHKRVYQGYRQLAKKEPERIKVVPYIPNNSEAMHQLVLSHIKPLIKQIRQ